jgi:hypothetical protein
MNPLKIIDLQIEDLLMGQSGYTGVEAVALVGMPAIETEFMYFLKQDFESITDYPQYITDNAIKAKIWVDENGYGDCMTPVGKNRLNQLANREPISIETIKRMKAYADRHKVDLESSKSFDDGCGLLAWYSWGLDETGRVEKWLETKIITIEEDMDYESSLPTYVNYATGKTLIEDVLFVSVNPNESKDDYLQRCIPVLRNEGYPEDQSVAMCIAKYENMNVQFEALGYMNGIPYFSTPEEAIIYGKENYNCDGYHTHTDDNGNEVYMSCATHDELPDVGVELESLLEQGWVIEDMRVVEPEVLLNTVREKYSNITEQKFYQIVADPNENSIMDNFGVKIRYVYVSGMGSELISTSRQFCKRMLGGKQYVFRYEDIMSLNAQLSAEDKNIIPRPTGTNPDIMQWKGGANCRHYWLELIFGNMNKGVGYEDKITNRKNDEIIKAQTVEPATGLAGVVNPPASTVRQSRTEFSKGTNRVIVVDIDDTLFDGLTPNMNVVNYVNSKWGGYRISIISARNSARLIETQSQLIRAGVRYDDLYLVNSPANKSKKAKELIDDGLRIVEVIENNPYTREDYRSLGIMKITKPESLSKVGFGLIPIGFIQGLPIFESEINAKNYSMNNGCNGIIEPVEYMGKQMFQSCRYNPNKESDFSKMSFKSDNEKRIIFSPLMLPNVLIPRIDEVTNEKYYVRFTPQTIEKIQRKFMIEQRLRETNLEHSNRKFNDIAMVESWIVTGPKDKAYELGYTEQQVPIGSWFGAYQVLETPEGDTIWNDFIKTGKVKGVSVEGEFMLKFSRIGEDEILLSRITDILSQYFS